MRTLTMFAMMFSLMAIWYVVHRIAHVIVTEFGLLGGCVACGAIYVVSLIMDRRGM